MNNQQKEDLIALITSTDAQHLECIAIARTRTDGDASVIITGSEEAAAYILATVSVCIESQPGASIH